MKNTFVIILTLLLVVSCNKTDKINSLENQLTDIKSQNRILVDSLNSVNTKFVKPFTIYEKIVLSESKNSPNQIISDYEFLIKKYPNSFWEDEAKKGIKNIESRKKYWSENDGWKSSKKSKQTQKPRKPEIVEIIESTTSEAEQVSIIGTWKIISYTSNGVEELQKNLDDYNRCFWTQTYTQTTVTDTFFSGTGCTSEGVHDHNTSTYNIIGTDIITNLDKKRLSFTYKILELTNTTLKLQESYKLDGENWIDISTYTKQ